MSATIITGCLAIGTVASLLGVCTKTLRRWDKAGKLKPSLRTPGSHRRYDRQAVLRAMHERAAGAGGEPGIAAPPQVAPRAAVYSRVSSTRQSIDGELDRQESLYAFTLLPRS